MRGEGRDAAIRCTVVGCPVLGAAFLLPRSALLTPRCGLNPLHCGAVVASPEEVTPRDAIWAVLIPFIAGQWSLRGGDAAWQRHAPRGRSRAAPRSFPSLRGSGRFAQATKKSGAKARPVSIPFIAGQWSLPAGASRSRTGTARVSIPFIAGQWSLRFRGYCRSSHHHQVSIPFIAGQWSLLAAGVGDRRTRRRVSIPFIAGQWSLPGAPARTSRRSGASFNPLHCGAVVASGRGGRRLR